MSECVKCDEMRLRGVREHDVKWIHDAGHRTEDAPLPSPGRSEESEEDYEFAYQVLAEATNAVCTPEKIDDIAERIVRDFRSLRQRLAAAEQLVTRYREKYGQIS